MDVIRFRDRVTPESGLRALCPLSRATTQHLTGDADRTVAQEFDGSSIETPRSLAYRLPTLAWVRACALRGEAGLRADAACAVAAGSPARGRGPPPPARYPAARLDTPGADTGQPRTVTAHSDSHT